MKNKKNVLVPRLFRICFAVVLFSLITPVLRGDAYSFRERSMAWGRSMTVIRSYDEIKKWTSPAKQFLRDHADKDFSLEEMLPIAEQSFLFLTGKEFPSGLHIGVGPTITKGALGEYVFGQRVIIREGLSATQGFAVLGHELGHVVSGEITDPILGEASGRAFEYLWMYSYEDERIVKDEESEHHFEFVRRGKIEVTLATALLHRLWKPGEDLVKIFQAFEEGDWSKLENIN